MAPYVPAHRVWIPSSLLTSLASLAVLPYSLPLSVPPVSHFPSRFLHLPAGCLLPLEPSALPSSLVNYNLFLRPQITVYFLLKAFWDPPPPRLCWAPLLSAPSLPCISIIRHSSLRFLPVFPSTSAAGQVLC